MVLQFGDAGRTVAIEGPGAVDGDDCPVKVVHDAGVEGDDGPRAAEAVAIADEVAYGDAFGADSDAEGEAAHSGHALRDAGAEEILVSDRDDALAGLRPEAGDAVGVFRVEEVLPLGVDVGV